jgi:hypothetical protein
MMGRGGERCKVLLPGYLSTRSGAAIKASSEGAEWVPMRNTFRSSHSHIIYHLEAALAEAEDLVLGKLEYAIGLALDEARAAQTAALTLEVRPRTRGRRSLVKQ